MTAPSRGASKHVRRVKRGKITGRPGGRNRVGPTGLTPPASPGCAKPPPYPVIDLPPTPIYNPLCTLTLFGQPDSPNDRQPCPYRQISRLLTDFSGYSLVGVGTQDSFTVCRWLWSLIVVSASADPRDESCVRSSSFPKNPNRPVASAGHSQCRVRYGRNPEVSASAPFRLQSTSTVGLPEHEQCSGSFVGGATATFSQGSFQPSLRERFADGARSPALAPTVHRKLTHLGEQVRCHDAWLTDDMLKSSTRNVGVATRVK
jgi:hypothetical protein